MLHFSLPTYDGQPFVLDNDPRLSPGVHLVQAEVDFGHATGGETDMATVTVAAPWVTADSTIMCAPAAVATDDHDPHDVIIERITAYPSNIVPGVSFDIIAFAPNNSWGRYVINAMG